MGSNKLTFIVVGLLALVFILVAMSGGEKKDEIPGQAGTGQKGAESADSSTGSGDFDSADTTIRTFTAQLEKTQDENKALRERLEAMDAKLTELEAQKQAPAEIPNEEKTSIVDKAVTEVMSRIDSLDYQSGKGQGGQPGAQQSPGYDIGMGESPGGYPITQPTGAGDRTRYVVVGPKIVAPVNSKNETSGASSQTDGKGILHQDGESSDRLSRTLGRAATEPEPRFTIPMNSTVLRNKSMTAMIGRIPFGGEVRDPFPFKITSGRESYVANGATLPDDVAGVVWSGFAVGDRTLNCLRGELHSVTFIFDDGTVFTEGAGSGSSKGGGGGEGAIGYIADRNGVPCIPGEYIGNAGKLLAGRVGASIVDAAAEAAAAAETTTITSTSDGSVGSAVTGDTSDYIRAKSLSGGARELADFVREYMRDQFDAIYLPPGTDVQVNVEKNIEIDYDPVGRKLRHTETSNLSKAGYYVQD